MYTPNTKKLPGFEPETMGVRTRTITPSFRKIL